jgi:hypothetical protein
MFVREIATGDRKARIRIEAVDSPMPHEYGSHYEQFLKEPNSGSQAPSPDFSYAVRKVKELIRARWT